MDDLQKCSQCLEIFNQKRLPFRLSTCPHYICKDCLNQVLAGSFQVVVCGFCTASVRKEEIVALPAPPEVVINSSRRQSFIEKQTSAKCEMEPEGVLLECEDETTDASSPTDGLCKLHQVHMDIICISDKERICPHCALFGNHKDHRFKRIQDFEKQTQQKIKAFDEITTAKQAYYQLMKENPQNSLQICIEKGKMGIKAQIQRHVQFYIECLRKKQQRLLEELDFAYQEVEEYCKKQSLFKKKDSIKARLQKWQEECQTTKQMVLASSTIQKKISCFYNSPLQIGNQGTIYLQDLKYTTETASQTMMSKIKEIRVSVDTHMESIIEKCLKIERINVNNFIMGTDFDQADDRYPFMDCSEIGMNSIDTLANNSIQVDISNLSQAKITPQLTKTIKKPISSKQEIKSMKSIQKKQPPKPHQIRKKLTQSPSKLAVKQSRVSQMGSIRSPSKILSGSSLKEILPGTDIKSSEIKQPQKIYNEFSKNSLTDFFDISDCNLPSERVVEFVQRARRIHKIRGLKLSSNHLNTQGFDRMIDSLKGVGNINLANNQVNEGIFDLLIKNRDRMDALKIINLSHNPINFEKKTNAKIEELKRMGVIVIL